QEGALQNSLLDQPKSDEQSAGASIPVQERVNGFELSVDESSLHQGREGLSVVQELLKSGERLFGWLGRRGDKTSTSRGRSTNPVLCLPELPGSLVWLAPSNILHQSCVHLAKQSPRQGKCLEALKTLIHCGDVVDDLVDVDAAF